MIRCSYQILMSRYLMMNRCRTIQNLNLGGCQWHQEWSSHRSYRYRRHHLAGQWREPT